MPAEPRWRAPHCAYDGRPSWPCRSSPQEDEPPRLSGPTVLRVPCHATSAGWPFPVCPPRNACSRMQGNAYQPIEETCISNGEAALGGRKSRVFPVNSLFQGIRRPVRTGLRTPPLPSSEASPSARCGRRKRNVPKVLQVRPLHCAARELRAAFSEWPVSLPTCGLKPPPYGQKSSPFHTVRRSGRGGSSSFLWLTKPQSLPNRLLNRSSNFLFEGRRFVLCSEANLG